MLALVILGNDWGLMMIKRAVALVILGNDWGLMMIKRAVALHLVEEEMLISRSNIR